MVERRRPIALAGRAWNSYGRIEMPRGTHPNSLANLKPGQFNKGFDPRRGNAPPLGASYIEWMNRLAVEKPNGKARYDENALKKIAKDPKAAAARRYAAQTMLRAFSDGWHKHLPLAGSDLDRIADRTIGKPVQAVHVEHSSTEARLTAASARLQEILTDPRLPGLIEQAKRQQAEQAEQVPVETVAKVLPNDADAAR